MSAPENIRAKSGGKFVKGRSGNPRGKPKGTPNKTTTVLKDAILQAFDKVGGADYLVGVASSDPKAFCALLGRVLPTEVKGDLSGELVVTIKRYSGD